MKRFLVVAFSCSLLGAVAAAREEPVPVSVIQLIATPEKFDGKLVSVTGYLVIGQELQTFLFLHREDAEHALDSNVVRVIPSQEMIRHKEELNDMYVSIVGVFRTTRTVGGWLATEIDDIDSCTVWSDPARPITHKHDNLHPPGPKPK